jgi:N-acetyl-gamma-glutamylphosphate reductase
LGIDVAFIPHVAAWFQGIHVSLPSLPNDETCS